jgi:signal transduction histidine kinase
MTIHDDGQGFDPEVPAPGHYGLVGMQERAIRAGGHLVIDSAPGEGTTLTVRLPLAPSCENSDLSQ